MKYTLNGAVNPIAAQALRRAGYDGFSAGIALIAWMNQLPEADKGTAPLYWKNKIIWIPYEREGRTIEIELEDQAV